MGTPIELSCTDAEWTCSSDATLEVSYQSWINSFSYSGGDASVNTEIRYSFDPTGTFDTAIPVNTFSEVPAPESACSSFDLTVWYDVSDDCSTSTGTVNRCSGRFQVVPDTEAPVFSTPPADASYSCFGDLPEPILLEWSDNCDGSGSVMSHDNISNAGCVEVITRTWTYTDSCGNTASVAQNITVSDTEAPVFEAPPADASYSCYADLPEPVALQWTDNCDGTGSVMSQEMVTGSGCRPCGCNLFQLGGTGLFV